MRTSPNDGVSERTCVLGRTKGRRDALIRLALGPDGTVAPDPRARAPGRGAWIGTTKPQLAAAVGNGKLKGALTRAFRTGGVAIPPDLPERVEAALQRDALDRLGLEARASTLATGAERVEDAARKGQVHLLLHAADASDDGTRKLAQAWRVGNDAEGSRREGLVLAVDRTILGVALGRENVVHIGVIEARAAERVARAIDRWHGFIERPLTGLACGDALQATGPSAREPVLEVSE